MDKQANDSKNGFNHSLNKLPAGFLRRLIMACSNPKFYVFPLSEKTSSTVGYFFKLLLLLGAIQVLAGSFFVWNVSGVVGENLMADWPDVYFQNGDLRIQNQSPYSLEIYQDYRIIIDPEGSVNRARLDDDVLAVAVNGRLFARSGPGMFMDFSTRYYEETKGAPEILVDTAFISDWLPYFRIALIFSLAALTLLELLFSSILRIVLISSGGIIARDNVPEDPGWGQLLLVSAYAITPVLIVQTVLFPLRLAGINIPYAEFITLVAGIVWVYFAINHYQENIEQFGTSSPPDTPENREI